MWAAPGSLLGLVLLCWLDASNGALFFLNVPSELHYDTEFLATVTAEAIEEPETIRVEYWSHNVKHVGPINSTSLTFTKDGVKNWGVTFPWIRMQDMDETMLDLAIYSESQDMGGTRIPDLAEARTLTFSRRSGYIFIQTDKPLYQPRQTVKFRILAVDERQKLATYTLKVDILNDQKIVVDRMRYTPDEAFKAQEFQLPREAASGIWSISAVYEGLDNSHGAQQTVHFEVKEYVLPQFYSILNISEDVITKSTNWLKVTVESRYVHGRPVIGQVEMRLGVWEADKGVTFTDYHLLEDLEDGKMTKDIRISKVLPRGRDFYRLRRLYVSVNVTEAGTLENDTIVDTSTFIAHPYYELTYNKSKTTFKPGFPFSFKMQTRAQSGRPASWIQAYVVARSYRQEGDETKTTFLENKVQMLDSNGEMQWVIDTPENADKIVFKTLILDLSQDYVVYEFDVPKAKSDNNQYMYISLEKQVKSNSPGLVLLQYTPPERRTRARTDRITVMVLAKGQVLFSTNTVRNHDGRSTVKIPSNYYWDLTPKMRVVAFFYSNSEMVMDSLSVDTQDICISELELHTEGGGIFGHQSIIEPKDSYTLEVHGGPYMKVGLVAVDQAVYLLNDKKTLTRESMFQQLGAHDSGTENGDGEDVEEIFKNSGLINMMFDSSATSEDDFDAGLRPIKEKDPKKLGAGISGSLFDFASHSIVTSQDEGPRLADAPPHTVRKYFPESWLFDEFTVPSSGLLNVNTKMPDSLTTWSFMAVGISAMRGVCVSKPHTERVEKLFFVDVRLPYKVTRLEVVKVRVAIYNFREDKVELYGQISGDGVCFPTERLSDWNDNGTDFTMELDRHSTKGIEIKMIPLRMGELTIRVDVALKNDATRDVVEKQLYVEAEGLRVKKSITFVLDPEAKHAKFRRVRDDKIVLSNTKTIKNLINMRTKKQETNIDLALPKEVIRGTERCRIAAFGDLMGDIINHAVIQSRSLMDQPVLDAEEVLGDLAPTVHALLYTSEKGFLDDTLAMKGTRFVKHAVSRLLNYRNDNAFSMKPNSKPATWLTAFVLKTLCHATELAFIDKANVVDKGFRWLLGQINENGTLNEQDWRLANDSFEYRLMLSADVLIALAECGSAETEKENWLELEGNLAFFLEEHLDNITHPMILAKSAYALNMFDPDSEASDKAVNRLLSMKRRTHLGHSYWASERENIEARRVPFWYHKGVKASSIEGTAFALLLFLERSVTNVDAIADWLVGQRNENGAFVGAMDSAVAIQALGMYSREKLGIKLDLHCNVTSFQIKEYKHSFKFTKKTAMRGKSVNNVPVSQVLQVATEGQGLGQMQVNVEYNIPIDKNEKCPFKVRVELKQAQATMSNLNKGPLCLSCNFGCPPEEREPARLEAVIRKSTSHIPGRQRRKYKNRGKGKSQRHRGSNMKIKPRRKCKSKNRKARDTVSIRQLPTASKKVICFKICLQPQEGVPSSGPISVDVEMLSGYIPAEADYKKIEEMADVKGVEYFEDSAILRIHFYQVAADSETCLGFRAVDDMEVGRPGPATVLIRQEGIPYPVCALEYKPLQKTASLQLYCASIGNSDRGECRCYSGLCSSCRPFRLEQTTIGISELRKYACDSDVAYQLQMEKWKNENDWFEIEARVKSVNKTGTHDLDQGDLITLQTPSSCTCPVYEYRNLNSSQSFYLLSSNVERLTDHRGNLRYRYLLDHRSHVLRVSKPSWTQSSTTTSMPSIKYEYLRAALRQC